ncbi:MULTISPECIES: CBS domain-containing protein [Mycolicibacterium]|uniref:CBS domain-containing protein n=1 Tax=Mycolicibacterium TaxID=1866885 RepID=UPI00148FA95E|nr:CBS domain-containing protein [Mycolicibacterium fortuitum]
MTTARDIMHAGATCIGEHETLTVAAQHMRDLGVGALPICGDDDRLHGMVTDRDIVIKCLASGDDPATTTAGQLAQGSPYYVSADADIEEMLLVMEEHQVRRLPVIDNHRLVGIVSEADIARHLPEHSIAEFVKTICAPAALTSH